MIRKLDSSVSQVATNISISTTNLPNCEFSSQTKNKNSFF